MKPTTQDDRQIPRINTAWHRTVTVVECRLLGKSWGELSKFLRTKTGDATMAQKIIRKKSRSTKSSETLTTMTYYIVCTHKQPVDCYTDTTQHICKRCAERVCIFHSTTNDCLGGYIFFGPLGIVFFYWCLYFVTFI